MEEVHPFDLQARAECAAASLTRLLDPERDGLMYFLANWRARPPRADHCLWDCGDGSGRHIDALTLARTMVRPGSPAAQADRGEEQIEAWMLRLLGDEGLTWLPPEPWAEPWGKQILLVDWRPGEPAAEINWAQRGTLQGLVSRFLRTGDERYLAQARRLVDGLLRVALRHPCGLYFPEGYYRAGGWRHHQPDLYPGLAEYNAAPVVPLLRLYQASGYPPALDLAEGLVRFALATTQGYLPSGRLRPPRGELEPHFHTRSNFILGVLQLGIALGRREYVAWARQSYEEARRWGTEFGWFPEGLGQRHGEVCCTTDMIEIALLLGQYVDRAYYADAERFGRNHLLESQFLSAERLAQAVEQLPADEAPPPWEGRYSTREGVVASQAGAFASRSTLNDAFHTDAAAMMQCCNAAGTRALYDLWRYAVAEEVGEGEGAPRQVVHLRFSVETPGLRVVSHEPAEGRLTLLAKRRGTVAVRLPAGAGAAVAMVADAGGTRAMAPPMQDGYASLELDEGQVAELLYPLPERTVWYQVGSPGRTAECAGHWRGETLLRVEPPGRFYPLYQRPAALPPVQPSPPAAPPIPSL